MADAIVAGGIIPDGRDGNVRPGQADGTAMLPLAAFTGSGWALFRICLVNILFTILTLGIYSFWGRVKVRRYLWEHTEILGEGLEYTGTGGELFKSFLAVMLLGGVGMLVYYACNIFFPLVAPFALMAVLVPVGHFASYQALRYRLTRTRWRGIRGNMGGSSVRFAVAGTGYSLLSFASLLVCVPLKTARLGARRINASFFGNRPFLFSGTSRGLFGPWMQSYVLLVLFACGMGLVAYAVGLETYDRSGRPDAVGGMIVLGVLLCIPLAGLSTLFYTAALVRWLFRHLAFGGLRFDASPYTPWGLCKLMLGNGALLLFTLGIARPWTEIRSLRFFCSAIRYSGDPDLETLLQDSLPERSRGEGLLDALDVDLAV